jgi:hypothetical protein
VLVGPIAVTPNDGGWSFEAKSKLDGRLLGFMSDSDPDTVVIRMGGRSPISGGSDGVVGSLHGPEVGWSLLTTPISVRVIRRQ